MLNLKLKAIIARERVPEIKAESRLAEIGLVRQPRLAVMPLTAQKFDIIANEMANKSME